MVSKFLKVGIVFLFLSPWILAEVCSCVDETTGCTAQVECPDACWTICAITCSWGCGASPNHSVKSFRELLRNPVEFERDAIRETDRYSNPEEIYPGFSGIEEYSNRMGEPNEMQDYDM